MKEIAAYECADGSLHAYEHKARAHDDDLLGTELDGLLKLFELDVTRPEEHRALLCVMKKRPLLKKALRALLVILDHTQLES